jgi:hypothetical protein
MREREILKQYTLLLLEAGAKVREDFIHVELVLPPDAGYLSGYGLQFTKSLFQPDLRISSDGRLYYKLCQGKGFTHARIILNGGTGGYGSDADLERSIYPTAFWDRLFLLTRHLKKVLFPQYLADVEVTCRTLATVRKEHHLLPRRETYLLIRMMKDFLQQELDRKRNLRRARNRKIQNVYEKMLALATSAPHSLNVLQGAGVPVNITRVSRNYWRVDAEGFSGWGSMPITAAAGLLRMHGSELSNGLKLGELS